MLHRTGERGRHWANRSRIRNPSFLLHEVCKVLPKLAPPPPLHSNTHFPQSGVLSIRNVELPVHLVVVSLQKLQRLCKFKQLMVCRLPEAVDFTPEMALWGNTLTWVDYLPRHPLVSARSSVSCHWKPCVVCVQTIRVLYVKGRAVFRGWELHYNVIRLLKQQNNFAIQLDLQFFKKVDVSCFRKQQSGSQVSGFELHWIMAGRKCALSSLVRFIDQFAQK